MAGYYQKDMHSVTSGNDVGEEDRGTPGWTQMVVAVRCLKGKHGESLGREVGVSSIYWIAALWPNLLWSILSGNTTSSFTSEVLVPALGCIGSQGIC